MLVSKATAGIPLVRAGETDRIARNSPSEKTVVSTTKAR
jgi:hypothetical protein